jgi:hypothetical protein
MNTLSSRWAVTLSAIVLVIGTINTAMGQSWGNLSFKRQSGGGVYAESTAQIWKAFGIDTDSDSGSDDQSIWIPVWVDRTIWGEYGYALCGHFADITEAVDGVSNYPRVQVKEDTDLQLNSANESGPSYVIGTTGYGDVSADATYRIQAPWQNYEPGPNDRIAYSIDFEGQFSKSGDLSCIENHAAWGMSVGRSSIQGVWVEEYSYWHVTGSLAQGNTDDEIDFFTDSTNEFHLYGYEPAVVDQDISISVSAEVLSFIDEPDCSTYPDNEQYYYVYPEVNLHGIWQL